MIKRFIATFLFISLLLISICDKVIATDFFTINESKVYEELIEEEKITQKFVTQNLVKQDNTYEFKFKEDIIVNANIIELTISDNSIEDLRKQLPDNFDENKIEWKKVVAQFAVGTSIIVVVGVVNYVTKGASTYFLFASPTKVAKDAIVGGAIGAVLNTSFKAVSAGKMSKQACTKYAIEGFASGYMWGAIYSVLGTAAENLRRLKVFKLAVGDTAIIKLDGTVLNKAGKKIGQAFYDDKRWYLVDNKKHIVKNVFDLKGKEIVKNIQLAANSKINLSSDISKLIAYTDDAAQVFRTANNLIPNFKYKLKGYEYFTDSKGRIKKVVFKNLKLKVPSNRLRLDIADKLDDIGKGFQKITDDRGHLIADLFDGDPSLANIVAMDKKVNQQTIKAIEDIWQKTLESGGKVKGSIDLKYVGNSFRPQSFKYTYSINDAKSIISNVIN